MSQPFFVAWYDWRMQPLIAITCGEVRNNLEAWSPIVHGQSQTYIDAVIHAGGVPFLVPLTTAAPVLHRLYALADGILFAGGNDPDPALYNEPISEQVTDISRLRDTVEMQLLAWTLADKKPLLGICRGMQLLNVYFGGTLYQDIPTDLPHASDHNSSTKRRSLKDIAHILKVKDGSKLAEILGGTTIGANTHHHQAIKKLGTSLYANAWSEDGMIEGIELAGNSFVIGVQAHPESLEAQTEQKWQKIFKAFVVAAQI
jgi:putative glutamine amidotransferase